MAKLVSSIIKNSLKEDVLIAAGNVCQCSHRGHAKEGFRCKTPVNLSSHFVAADGASWYSSDSVMVLCDACYSGHANDLGLPSQFTIPPR